MSGTRLASPPAMLRISPGPDDGSAAVVLRLEGELRGPWVDELRREAMTAARPGNDSLILDLANLLFIDASGIALLRDLAARGALLRGGSLFVAAQLQEAADAD